jgi:hypothetical protein
MTAAVSPLSTTLRTAACLRATSARSYSFSAGFELSTSPRPLHSPMIVFGSPPPAAMTPANRTDISPAAVDTTRWRLNTSSVEGTRSWNRFHAFFSGSARSSAATPCSRSA